MDLVPRPHTTFHANMIFIAEVMQPKNTRRYRVRLRRRSWCNFNEATGEIRHIKKNNIQINVFYLSCSRIKFITSLIHHNEMLAVNIPTTPTTTFRSVRVITQTLRRRVSSCVCGDKNRYFKPKHELFQTLTKWLLCSRSTALCKHNISHWTEINV